MRTSAWPPSGGRPARAPGPNGAGNSPAAGRCKTCTRTPPPPPSIRARSNHKHDVMLQDDGVKIKASGLRNQSGRLTIACSILLSMATTLAPEELKEKRRGRVMQQPGGGGVQAAPAGLPIVEAQRRALLPEHRGQKRDGEIPQLTNADVHRHRVALRVHARPALRAPAGQSRAAPTGAPAVEK